MTKIKLTNQNMQTYEGFQWELGKEVKTSGKGELCTSGWLHCYDDLLVGLFMNPIHGHYINPRAFEALVKGKGKHDNGLKSGYKSMTLIKELPVPGITLIQRITFGILCALEVYREPYFVKWATNWLDGTDRSVGAAIAAADAAADAAAGAARATRAAESAAWAAADAAAWAARAARATRAAESASWASWAARAAAESASWAARAARATRAAEGTKLDLPGIAKKAMEYK